MVDMESWESVNPSEKWSMFKDEQKQEIEKYISSLRSVLHSNSFLLHLLLMRS